MSALAAVLWTLGIHTAFLWLLTLMVAMRAATNRDLVSQLLCQLAAYGLGLFLLLRAHGPEASVRSFVATRPSAGSVVMLGALAGAALAVPASWLLELVERQWPPAQPGDHFTELLTSTGPVQQYAVAAGVVLAGPLVEEALFRGALFCPLRKRYGQTTVVVLTSLLFAGVHLDPRRMLPIFLVGLVLGYLRAHTGSLWPALAAHLGFNAVPVVEILWSPPRVDGAEASEPVALVLASAALAAVALLASHLLARRNPRALHARAQDG